MFLIKFKMAAYPPLFTFTCLIFYGKYYETKCEVSREDAPSVKSHGDSQWLSEFGWDASQDSTTLEAGYTFIKTQRQTAVYQYVQKKKRPPQLGFDWSSASKSLISHYKLQEFFDSLSESMACIRSHGHPRSQPSLRESLHYHQAKNGN